MKASIYKKTACTRGPLDLDVHYSVLHRTKNVHRPMYVREPSPFLLEAAASHSGSEPTWAGLGKHPTLFLLLREHGMHRGIPHFHSNHPWLPRSKSMGTYLDMAREAQGCVASYQTKGGTSVLSPIPCEDACPVGYGLPWCRTRISRLCLRRCRYVWVCLRSRCCRCCRCWL